MDVSSVSIRSHKIVFTSPLGKGITGAVYEVIPRPTEDRGCLLSCIDVLAPRWLSPYLYEMYDWAFPPAEVRAPSPLCVKVYHSYRAQIASLDRTHLEIASSPKDHQKERETNETLVRYGLSSLRFYESEGGMFFQFKTRVMGNTLRYYLENGFFSAPGQFALRKNFVDFLILFNNPRIILDDMHTGNMMYDEKKERWEIVDGGCKEVKERDSTIPDNISFLNIDMPFSMSDPNYHVFTYLFKTAREGRPYSREDEEIVMRQIAHLIKDPFAAMREYSDF